MRTGLTLKHRGLEPSQPLCLPLPVHIRAGGERGDRAVRHGGGELTDALGAAVARRKHAGGRSRHILVRDDIASLVGLNGGAERVVLRLLANGDEQAADIERRLGGGRGIFQQQPRKRFPAPQRFHDGVGVKDHVCAPAQQLDEPRFSAESLAAVNQVYGAAIGREQQRILQGGVAAAGDRDVRARKERPVADRAVGNAGAGQAFLVFKAEAAVAHAGRNNDAAAENRVPVVRRNAQTSVSLPFESGDGFKIRLRAEIQNLRQQPVGQFPSADLRKSRIIFHAGRKRNLSAVAAAFEQQRAFSGPAGIQRRRQAGRTGADDNDVVQPAALRSDARPQKVLDAGDTGVFDRAVFRDGDQRRSLLDAVLPRQLGVLSRVELGIRDLRVFQKHLRNLAVRTGLGRKEQVLRLGVWRAGGAFVRFLLLLRGGALTAELGVRDVVDGALLEFLRFAVVPVLDGAVVTGDSAVYLRLLAAVRAFVDLAGEISVVFADRIGRRQRVVGQRIVLRDLAHERGGGAPVGQLFAEESVEHRAGGVERLQLVLDVERLKDILGKADRQMRAVGIIGSRVRLGGGDDVGIARAVVLGETVRRGFRRSGL